MKELSIEEKAKAYDELIKRLNKAREDVGGYTFKSVYDEVMSELAESEDERMRRWIINYLDNKALNSGIIQEKTNIKNAIAWLEKQGEKGINGKNREIPFSEQKPNPCGNCGIATNNCQNFPCVIRDGEQKSTDKVEPKFKVGDFIVNDYCMGRIVEITNDAYLLDTEQGIPFSCHSTRLWDIAKDAKDGDVLCCESGWTCIFKTLVNDETFSSYCFMDNTKWFCETGSECHTLKEEFVKAYNGKICPATKEQRDQLEKAMADAGYTFDFEKKELKKIEQKPAEDVNLPEFESYLCLMLQKFRTKGMCTNGEIIDFVEEYSQKLRDILAKPAWSEEDEKYLIYNIEQDYRDKLNNNPSESLRPYYNKVISLLKSIRHQKQWKPSDEQMYILNWVTNLLNDGMVEKHAKGILESLYNDLKKLKE